MQNYIHPTAVIDPKAHLGQGNYVGPFCVVGPHVSMGNGNRLESHVSIGMAAQHRAYFLQEAGGVEIGDNNIFREFTTVNGGTTSVTRIGNEATLLIGSHVGHDAHVRDQANLGNNVVLGGHSIIGYRANLGLHTVVHQYRVVGACAMVGMNSTVTKDIPPFVIAFGTPCEPHRLNRIGLQRSHIATEDLAVFEDWFSNLGSEFGNPMPIRHMYNKYISEFEADRMVWNAARKAG